MGSGPLEAKIASGSGGQPSPRSITGSAPGLLEVNKTDYETCNSDHPRHNWTGGAGRDVVPLNVTRHYYFISGKGFCYNSMKVAIRVENPPPPPVASPVKSAAPPFMTFRAQVVVPAVFAIAAVWDSFLGLW